MRPDKQLDYAVFQLNSTRTRCELLIASQGMTYKLAAGLLHPFVAHLKAAEVQLAGGSYSIRLEPQDPSRAAWFTKGTLERFVRFVSTPEMLERVSTIEMELLEIDKVMLSQSEDASEVQELLSKSAHSSNVTVPNDSAGGTAVAHENSEKFAKESSKDTQLVLEKTQETTKQLLMRALKTQQIMLEKDLELALAYATSAGFNSEHVKDLIVFAEVFGAKRLWVACSSLLSLFKRRQQSLVWQDDSKLSVADGHPTETGFSGNIVNHAGLKDNLDLQGRVARHDDLRRASLPVERKPLQGNSGLEKLTRRGSLDELTGEFLQLSARMKSSGMLEGPHADRFNNWQPPPGGGSHQCSGEIHIGGSHLGGNIDAQDGRGHPFLASWKGHPQNHPMQGVHTLMQGPIHSGMPTPFGFQGRPASGYSYSTIPSGPYLGSVYAEANGWQFSSPMPPSFWPHPLYNNAAAPPISGGVPHFSSQKQEANGILLSKNEVHEQPTLPLQKLINESSNQDKSLASFDESHGDHSAFAERSDQLTDNDIEYSAFDVRGTSVETPDCSDKELCKKIACTELSFVDEPAAPMQREDSLDKEFHKEATPNENKLAELAERPASKLLNYDKFQADSTQTSFMDPTFTGVMQHTLVTQHQPPITNEVLEEKVNGSSSNGDVQPLNERTRRLPIRTSSPSRRSASPLRKVQIGRSGSRKAIKGFNHVAQNASEKTDIEIKDRDSSESWSEDDDSSKIEKESKEQPLRSSVQDVIGLFERKKDAGDTKTNFLRKDFGRIKSNNSVLKRWTESVALTKESMEPEDSAVTNQRNQAGSVTVLHEDGELMAACNGESRSEQIFAEQPAREESKVIQKEFPNLDSVVLTNKISDNSNLTPKTKTVLHGKACNLPQYDGTQELGTDRTGGESLNDRQENDDDEEPESAHPRKLLSLDEKAKLMQELLQKRKIAWGNRAVKPNPLAEAQVRAEKLRAYKADLQKSKQEKDEEEKKRLEDLKSQRKERIAARGGPLGGLSTQSPASKQTPPLTAGNRSSPSLTSQKYFSSNSPRTPINGPASSLSPNPAKSKGAFGNNKLPRILAGTLKANENAMSRSVPSLDGLKKESPKVMTGLRSSTGSQRISQLKKNLKVSDLNTSPKANGHIMTARKGIPPAKDMKNEASPAFKKSSSVANKQQKKPGSSLAYVKETASETIVQQGDAANDTCVEESLAEGDNDKHETCASSSLVREGGAKDDNGYAHTNVEAFNELQLPGSIDNSSCLADGEFAASSELLPGENLKEDFIVFENSYTDLTTCLEAEQKEDDNYEKESCCDTTAQDSQTDEFSKDLDASRDDTNVHINSFSINPCVSMDEHHNIPPPEDFDPPSALPTDSSLNTPKNLPRLLEAIQEAHSPDLSRSANGSKKLCDESVTTRSSKDNHARGLKRLLFLGRKTSRSSFQNSSEFSVSTMADARVGDGASSTTGIGSSTTFTDTVTGQADKSRDGHLGSSLTKGSRSFFSLSTLRGKGDSGK